MARDERTSASRRDLPVSPPAGAPARGGDSEDRWLEAALHSIPDGVIYLDAQLIVRAANRAMCRLLERRPSSLIGRSLGDAARVTRDPGGQPYDLERQVARCIADYSSREVGPLRFEKRTGRTDPMFVTIMPYGRGRTAVKGCALFVRPVTPEESAERLRDAILSLVSHELRTPLLHIKGAVGSLLAEDVEWDEETRLYFLRAIDHGADRLSSLVDDLLAIAAMHGGQVPLNLEDTEPWLLVAEGVDEASPFLGDHRVSADVPKDLPTIRVDVSRVLTVLVNLLENAAKYSESGTAIEITAAATGRAVQFSVRDEGPGIDDEHRQDIFDPFFRVEPRNLAGGERPDGTGLGLAVARAVVEAHGGRIWAEGAEGGGANFQFTIPRADLGGPSGLTSP